MAERRPIVFLDTETDGVHPGRRVWEVGMIRREPDGTEQSTQFFVDIDLSTADPFGLKIGRFYERHPLGIFLASGPGRSPDSGIPPEQTGVLLVPPFDAAMRVARWTHGCDVVGAVPSFDAETLDRLLRSHELIGAWHYHLIDVETLAAGALRLPPPWDFDYILRQAGLVYVEEDRHTALGDAIMVRDLYDAVMAGALIPA